MEELPDIEYKIITKLKSSLPICRVCLDVSMEYIEFEATLCVLQGREISFSEGFHELIQNDKDLPYQNMTTNFCATCGNDLLNAYLFMKRIEHANNTLKKLKILTQENSKLIVEDQDDGYNNDDQEETDVMHHSNLELEDCKESSKTEVYQDILSDIGENAGSNNSLTFDHSIKIESIEEEDSEYQAVYVDAVSMDKDDLLSEPEKQIVFAEEVNELEPHCNISSGGIATLLSNECTFICETEEVSESEEQHNLESTELLRNEDKQSDMLFHEYFNQVDNNEYLEKKDYICNICSCDFKTKRSLNFHKLRAHNNTETNSLQDEEYKKCQYCQSIIRKAHMEKHLVTHSTEIAKEYSCTLCVEKFPTKIGLKQHSYSHAKDHNRYACHICGKICLRAFTLRNHIQCKHLSERRKHQCEDCGLFFRFPSLLREHKRKHNINSRFQCSHCDRTFLRKPQLDIHMRYHLNDFPYKCDQCDKCYVTKSNLTDHIKSKHTKTTYDCDICQQKFKSQTGLRKHKYSHDGYPYVCPLCSAGQTSRSGMKQHLMGVHKDALTEEEFDAMFPIIYPKSGYRRPKHM